jgi:proline iminopeptidase
VNRTLVLRSNYQWPSGRTFEMASGPLPWAYTDAIWGFHLRPAPAGRTRLVARTRTRGRPRPVTWLFDLLDEPLHFSMQTRQFHNLRVRVGAERDLGLPPGYGI